MYMICSHLFSECKNSDTDSIELVTCLFDGDGIYYNALQVIAKQAANATYAAECGYVPIPLFITGPSLMYGSTLYWFIDTI